MSTDWTLVRTMMNSAIEACERLEVLGIREEDRSAVAQVNGQTVSVSDVVTSAWTYPERVRHEIIRQRRDAGADQPYVPETARILVNMAQACAELIGGGKSPPADRECRAMARWYGEHALPLVEQALRDDRKAG